MARKDVLPDWLTAFRGLAAVAILALTLVGPAALRAVAFLLLVGWTTDMIDGRLARRWDKDSTWIGEHEFHADMLMVFSSVLFLVLTGLVPRLPAVGYLVGGTAISLAVLHGSGEFLRFKSVTMILAFPWVFLPFVIALWHDPVVAYVGLAWVVVALVTDWRRFTGVVGDFLTGARAFFRRP